MNTFCCILVHFSCRHMFTSGQKSIHTEMTGNPSLQMDFNILVKMVFFLISILFLKSILFLNSSM